MKKLFLFYILFAAQMVSAATNTEFYINGHVLDSKGEHIAHATVSVEGTTVGTVADETGHFTLRRIPTGDQTIVVSMVGYVSDRIEIEATQFSKSLDLTFKLKEDALSLDQVVVSANRTEVTRRKSPTVVTVMPAEMFANVGAPTLADGIVYQPGVRVEDNCQNCGFTQVRINGLDGHYSQILIDSRPMFSALTGVYGLEQIPANMIDRVEVIRGGGSALFGSSAIGGTINIITKTPEYNSAEFAHSLSVIEKGVIDNNTTANLSFVSDNQRAGATLFGQHRSRDSYDANGDGYTEIPELRSTTLGMRSYLKTGDYSKLSLQYDYSTEYRRGGNDLELPAHLADIAEMVEHNINGGGVNFDLFSRNYARKLNIFASTQYTARESYYGETDEENPIGDAYGTTDELIFVTGAQFSQSWDELLFMPAEFVAGVEYNYNDLEDKTESYDHLLQQTIHTTSAYLQNEWRNDKFGILVGVRADKNSLLDNVVFSPRLNLRYNPSESVNFRATYSTGFRAPQAFDEDLHISVVGGEVTMISLADDLKQENSQSFSISADLYKNFNEISTNLLVEGFYTKLDDVFATRDLGTNDAGIVILERYNASGATVKGITAEARVVIPDVVTLQAAATYQKSRYAEAEEWSEDAEASERMFRTPDAYGYLTANFDLTKKLQLSVSSTFTGSMLVQHCAGSGTDVDIAVETPSFVDANFKLGYTFTLVQAVRMEVYGGVQNIFNSYQKDFDTGSDRDPGYVYGPINPRRYTFGAKLMF
ncbi:MAG: TonB-dependent receptor [Rikenellaceae bacterium]